LEQNVENFNIRGRLKNAKIAEQGSYSGFHACIVVQAVVDSRLSRRRFAGGVELHA